MLVADLRHFLDVDDSAHASLRRLVEHLTAIVRAGTSRPSGLAWVTAIACMRRPQRRRCPGLIGVVVTDVPAMIRWRCAECGDDGVITDWMGTPFDLRSSADAAASTEQMVVSAEVAATLRTVLLLDVELERVVHGARLVDDSIILEGSADEFEALADAVAAEANHEPGRARQRRLDDALDALSSAV